MKRLFRHKIRLVLIVLGLLLALYVVIGYFVAPGVVQGMAEEKLAAALQAPVTIGEVALDPWSWRGSATDIAVTYEGEEPWLIVERAELGLSLPATIRRRAPVLREVRLVGVQLRIVRESATELNISELFRGGGGSLPRVVIEDLQLVSGTVELVDQVMTREFAVENLRASLPWLSTLPGDREQSAELQAWLDFQGHPVYALFEGQAFAERRQGKYFLRLESVDLHELRDYLPLQDWFRLRQGSLFVDLTGEIAEPAGTQAPKLTAAGRIVVSDLQLVTPAGNPLLAFHGLTVDLEEASLPEQRLVVARVLVDRPDVQVQRRPATSDPEPAPALAEMVAMLESEAMAERLTRALEPLGSWDLTLQRLAVVDGSVDFVDRTLHRPFRAGFSGLTFDLEGLRLAASEVTGEGNEATVALASRLGEGRERVSLEATFALGPPRLRAELRVNQLDLVRCAPYYEREVGLRVNGGTIDLRAELIYEAGDELALSGNTDFTVRDLELAERSSGRALLTLPELRVEGLAVDLAAGALALHSAVAERPQVWLLRDAEGQFTVLRELGIELGKPPAEPPPWAGLVAAATLAEVRVEKAVVNYEDRTFAEPFRYTLRSFEAEVTDLTTAEAGVAEIRVGATGLANEQLAIEGTLTLARRHFRGAVRLDHFEPARFAVWYQPWLAGQILGGTVAADLAFTYAGGFFAEGTELSAARLELVDFALQAPGSAGVDLGWEKALVNLTAKPSARRVEARIEALGPHLELRRAADGSLNLLRFLPEPSAPAPAADAPAPPTFGELADWRVELTDVALRQGDLTFEDRQLLPDLPITLGLRSLRAGPLRWPVTGDPAPYSVNLTFGQGELALAGQVVGDAAAAELSGKGSWSLQKPLQLASLQPYLGAFANAQVTGGTIAGSGRFQGTVGGAKPTLELSGDLSIDDFRSLGPTGKPLLELQAVKARGLGVTVLPAPEVLVSELDVNGARAAVTIRPDRSPDWLLLPKRREPAADGATEPTGAAFPLRVAVGEIALAHTGLIVRDRSLNPVVELSVAGLQGKVQDWSFPAAAGESASLDLQGRINGQAPVQVRGTAATSPTRLEADLEIDVTALDLAPFSPYGGRYLGYGIRKGNTTLDLHYRLQDLLLTGENQVVLEQLRLGDAVKSDEAPQLPLKLALAVLRDRNGAISLNVPVRGRLDDPNFRLSRTIVQAFVNVLSRVALSPFDMLTSVLDLGDRQLEVLEFAPGQVDLPGQEAEELEILGKALVERESLRLEITPEVNVAADTDALTRATVDKRLRALRFAELQAEGNAPEDMAAVTIAESAREGLLTQLWRQSEIPKEYDAEGFLVVPPLATIEAKLRAHLAPPPEEYRLLALRRAQKARAALIAQGVSPDRVFILEPHPVEKPGPPRLHFSLR